MCRYAMVAYKPHFACFNCRKTFKRRLMADIQRGEDSKFEAKCPECAELMADMGKDFESPKKTDLKRWAHLKTLYTVGISYHSCGCSGPGYIPSEKQTLLAFFKELIESFEKELVFGRARIEPTNLKEIDREQSKYGPHIIKVPAYRKSKNEVIKSHDAIAYWISRIKEIEDRYNLVSQTG